MTDSDVMESIGRTLGFTCMGVYWVLERHANKQGQCSPSEERIAAMGSVTPRTVRTSIAKLKEAGWIKVVPRKNHFGVTITNEYELPHHPSSIHMEAPEEVPEEDLKNNTSSKVVRQVATEVEGSIYPKPKTKRRIPDDYELTDDLMGIAINSVLNEMQAVDEFEKFKLHHQSKGTTMLRWDLAWKTWCLNWKSWHGAQVTNYVPVVKPVTKEDKIAELVKAREKYEASGDQGFIDHINRLIAEEEAK